MFPLLFIPAALALPFVVERFDAGRIGDGWKTVSGAEAGKPGGVGFGVEEGALVLRQSGGKGILLSRKVELREVRWIRVVARTRVEGTETAPPDANCGVVVRFEHAEPLRPMGCSVQADWVGYTRYYAVPVGAREVELSLRMDTRGVVAIDDLMIEPVVPDLKALTRGHFVYHWLGDDSFSEAQFTTNDELYTRLVEQLGLGTNPRVDYWKYPDEDTLEAYTGRRTPMVKDGLAIHTLLRADTRQLVAALTTPWGEAPAAVREGLAIHLSGEWDGRDHRLVARGLVGSGAAPTLATLLDPAAFEKLPTEVRAPLSGAFVSWLVTTQGVAAVRGLYAPAVDPRNLPTQFSSATGMTLAEAETRFRTWL